MPPADNKKSDETRIASCLVSRRTILAMPTHLTLTPEEARLLLRHLTQRLEHLDAELVRTDKRELQHALALEIDALRTLTERIRAAAAGSGEEALPEMV
jgi:hypothetical protein